MYVLPIIKMQVGDADMTHKTLKLPNTRLEEKCQMYFPY